MAGANYLSASVCAHRRSTAGRGVLVSKGVHGRRQGAQARAEPRAGPDPALARGAGPAAEPAAPLAGRRCRASSPCRARAVRLSDHRPLRAATSSCARTTGAINCENVHDEPAVLRVRDPGRDARAWPSTSVMTAVNSPWAWRSADRRVHLARLVLLGGRDRLRALPGLGGAARHQGDLPLLHRRARRDLRPADPGHGDGADDARLGPAARADPRRGSRPQRRSTRRR